MECNNAAETKESACQKVSKGRDKKAYYWDQYVIHFNILAEKMDEVGIEINYLHNVVKAARDLDRITQMLTVR